MFNLMIVDDERIVIDGLKDFVDWNGLGFDVVADAESAREALEALDSKRVDVVLTDIVMPDMNGLQLIRELKKLDRNIKMVILSGYGEFEYAKEAIRLGAFDFLMKPVNFVELGKIFENIKVLLEDERKQARRQQEYYNLMKEQVLNNLVKGFYKDEQILARKLSESGLLFEAGDYRIIRLYISGQGDSLTAAKGEEYIQLKSKIYCLTERYLNQAGSNYVFNNDLNEIAAFVFCDGGEDLLSDIISKMQEEIKSSFGTLTHIGIGSIRKDIIKSAVSYSEAGKALEYKLIKRDSSILFYDSVMQFFKGQSVVTEEVKSSILLHLTQADGEGLVDIVCELLNKVCRIENININYIYNTCIEIFLIINKYITNDMDKEKNLIEKDQTVIKTLLTKESIEDIKIFMAHYINESINIVKSARESTAGSIAENAKKYINEHFSEEITLNKLSEFLYVHPIYLSKLFKDKTGENFIDYLTRVRIEKAKKLLEDLSLKIYVITEMVGYDSSKYFSKTFKELVGLTPKEYRDSIA